MASATGYVYHPLKAPSSIRLVKILPDRVGDKISCTIEEFQDQEQPEYCALSYCWGDPAPTRTILLNGHERRLHENLWQFLRQMQESGRCSSYYWTDSLCLDQANHTELNQQVPRMGTIYTNAALGVVWLGQDIGRGEELWACPYWERTWIIQEFLLPKDIVIAYDKRIKDFKSFVEHIERQISWERYSALGVSKLDYELLKHCAGLRWENASPSGAYIAPTGAAFDTLLPYSLGKGSSWTRPSLFAEYFLANGILELCRWREDPKRNLYDLLDFTSNCQSTEEADKVYGLLGLANEPLIGERIDVNYDKTIEEIYWDLLFELTPPTNVDQPRLHNSPQHKPQQQTVQQWQDFLLKVQHALFGVPNGWKPYDFRNLVAYANSSRISHRHRKMALATLYTLQAMHTMQEKAAPVASLIRSISWEINTWEANEAQRAAALALALSSVNDDDDQCWETTQPNGGQGNTAQRNNPWRCWRHREHTDNDHRPASAVFDNDEPIKIFLPQIDEIQSHELCGQAEGGPEPCDESIFTLELPGLEISIWTDDKSFRTLFQRDSAALRVNFLSD